MENSTPANHTPQNSQPQSPPVAQSIPMDNQIPPIPTQHKSVQNSTLLVLGIALVLLLGIATSLGYYIGIRQATNASDVVIPEPTQTQQACTMEAKLCPDGSSVGRVGPNCEFAACPETPTTP